MLIVVLTMVDNPYLYDCLNAIKNYNILVIKNGPVTIPSGVRVVDTNDNWGCAKSWNFAAKYAFQHRYPGVVILNDDVIINGDLNILRYLHPQYFWRIHGYSAFYLTQEVYAKVGEFDEGYWPIYYEDCDYGYRMKLSKVQGIDIDQTPFVIPYRHGHIEWEPGKDPYAFGGASNSVKYSAILKKVHSQTHALNQQRYKHKWGGMPGQEINLQPNEIEPTRDIYERTWGPVEWR